MKKEKNDPNKGSFLDKSLWIKLRSIDDTFEDENYFFVVKEHTNHWMGFKGNGTAITFERISEEFYKSFVKENYINGLYIETPFD